jgi:hypothetical protein
MRAVASVALRYLTRYSPGRRATVIPSPPIAIWLRDQDKAVRKNTGTQEWLRFYERALRYIIEINTQGRRGRGIT